MSTEQDEESSGSLARARACLDLWAESMWEKTLGSAPAALAGVPFDVAARLAAALARPVAADLADPEIDDDAPDDPEAIALLERGDFTGAEARAVRWRSSRAVMLRAMIARAEGRFLDAFRFGRLRLECSERRASEGKEADLPRALVERLVVLAALEAAPGVAADLARPSIPDAPEDARERDALLFVRARIESVAGDFSAAARTTETLVREAAEKPREVLAAYLVERAAALWNVGRHEEAESTLAAAEIAISWANPVIASQAAATLRGWNRAIGRSSLGLDRFRLPYARIRRANERREAAALERARASGLLSSAGF